MKVLFAVNNDKISEAIVKKYQKEYKEIISYKNVYYFSAILKELQKDKSYNRVVISEDLEPFANNDYTTIDKFIFEKLDKISDEATNVNGKSIEIIVICADRRSMSDEMLIKFFGIGIYNAIIGQDRSIDAVCKLINQPRNKKEAKTYYKIEATNVGYQSENENNVSEAELQNILAHYKRLGKDEDKYVDSFNNIVSQYTDAQLKIIIRYLPMNVKAVLEERSPKYQELSTFSVKKDKEESDPYKPRSLKSVKEEEKIKVKMLNDEVNRPNITKPIIVPGTLNTSNIKKIIPKKVELEPIKVKPVLVEEIDEEGEEDIIESPKKGRGRPRKNPIEETEQVTEKRGRGRPKKSENKEEEVDLFNLSEEENEEKEEEVDLFNLPEENISKPETNNEVDLFNLSQEQEDSDDIDLFNLSEEENIVPSNNVQHETYNEPEVKEVVQTNPIKSNSEVNTYISKDKKVACFIGTTKNGTSFVVNNVAELLSSMNISTAILDITKNRNSYYIYTKNQENLRQVASGSIRKLQENVAEGIEANKNLTIYTELPGENIEYTNIQNMIKTLLNKHDLVLIDCDFDTPVEFFEIAQEIFLVQSMDVLTIQPLTAFLRELKTKNILKQEKIKIIINKEQKIRSLSDKTLIGGIAFYNDPAMSFMTELFDKETVQYCKIPFETQNYAKYLDSLVDCEINLRGYTKSFMIALNELAGMVYPLLNKTQYSPMNDKKSHKMQFSDKTNNTLNRMKKNY